MLAPLVKLRKYLLAGQTAVRGRWAYPADVAGTVFSYALFIFVFSRLWATVYEHRATIAGYDQHQLTWYFIVSELVLFSVGGSTFLNLANDIKTGQVAYTLSRPWAYPVTALSEALLVALSLMVPFAVVGWLVGSWSAGWWVPVSPLQVSALFLSLLLTVILQFLCQFLLAMTAFWVEENAAFLWIHQKFALILGTFLPLEFFPAAWRPWVEATPYGWLAYPPSRLAVAFEPQQVGGLLAGQLVWIALLGVAVGVVYAVGRRRTVLQGG